MSFYTKLCLLLFALFTAIGHVSMAQRADSILLKNYRPKSIYKVPVTKIEKARYPVIDMHSHSYAKSAADIERWIALMDKYGIEKTLILSYTTGKKFDSVYNVYSKYKDRFDIWCGFDY